jgi:hypothetical protein
LIQNAVEDILKRKSSNRYQEDNLISILETLQNPAKSPSHFNLNVPHRFYRLGFPDEK